MPKKHKKARPRLAALNAPYLRKKFHFKKELKTCKMRLELNQKAEQDHETDDVLPNIHGQIVYKGFL